MIAIDPVIASFAESLARVIHERDVARLREYLRGRHLPALGGNPEPADVVHRALAQTSDPQEAGGKLAELLARVISEEEAETLGSAANRLDAGCKIALLNALHLAACLPASAPLFVALRNVLARLRVPRLQASMALEELWLPLWRALTFQQVDESLEEDWLALLRGSPEDARPWTSGRRTLVLEAWRGLLLIPPKEEHQYAGEVVNFERIERGLRVLNESLDDPAERSRTLQQALAILMETYPRSSQFWVERWGDLSRLSLDHSWERPTKISEHQGTFRSPVIRLNVDQPVEPASLGGPLRILVVASSPAGFAPLDLEQERRQIEETWGRQYGIELEFLERADVVALRDNLLERPAHVLHYMGHGGFEGGEGALVFENWDHRPELVSGRALASQLQLPTPPALVVLNACETGRRRKTIAGFDPFAGVATALIQAGFPAVVAMKFPISDRAALAFSEAFYRRLAVGDPVETAIDEGRLAIEGRDSRSRELATPVLFLRTEKTQLAFPFRVPPRIAEHIQTFDLYIQEKTRGFVSRQFVFDAVQRFIDGQPRGYFLVRGDPGIGKTALLAELARTKKHVRHFNIRLQNVTRADQFLKNVCAQVIARYRLGHAALPPDADRNSAFLLDVLAKAAREGKEKIVVLVDALDEADVAGLSSNANLLCLPESLPQGVYLVATARNLREDQLPLRIDCENDGLLLDHDSRENLADVEIFLRNQLAVAGIKRYLEAQRLAPEDFVRELVDKSEGNFMYLRCVLWEMESNPRWERAIDQLPKGLKSYYEDHWRRMRAADERLWIDAKLPVLLALTVTREPIPVELIARFSQVDDRRVIRSVLRDWKPFLHEEGETIEERRFQLYSASFFEFLKNRDEVAGEHVSFRAANQALEAMLDLGETPSSD